MIIFNFVARAVYAALAKTGSTAVSECACERHRQRETMAGGGGSKEELGYVKRLLRAHSEEGEDRLEEERTMVTTAPSKEDSWVLRKKASFESMWGGGGSQSLSLCLPKQDHYVSSKSAKEEKQREAFQVEEEKVNEVETPVKTVIKEEEAATPVTAVAKEIDTDEIFGGADKSKHEQNDLFREVVDEEEDKDTDLWKDEGTGSQSDSEEKGGDDGLNEEAEEEVPTPAEEEAVTLLREKVGGSGCIQGGGAVPEGGAVDTVTREEAIR